MKQVVENTAWRCKSVRTVAAISCTLCHTMKQHHEKDSTYNFYVHNFLTNHALRRHIETVSTIWTTQWQWWHGTTPSLAQPFCSPTTKKEITLLYNQQNNTCTKEKHHPDFSKIKHIIGT